MNRVNVGLFLGNQGAQVKRRRSLEHLVLGRAKIQAEAAYISCEWMMVMYTPCLLLEDMFEWDPSSGINLDTVFLDFDIVSWRRSWKLSLRHCNPPP